MAKELECIPDDVDLRCGMSTKVIVMASDGAHGVKITALGFDSSVASVNPSEGTTNNDGILEVLVTCAQEGLCPGDTRVTFYAKGYEEDILDIECQSLAAPPGEDFARVAFVDVPLRVLPKVLSRNIGLFSVAESAFTKSQTRLD